MSQMPSSLTNRWTPRILYQLDRAPMRFNALARAIDAPSARMLSQLLKKLVRDGVLIRDVVALDPGSANVRYSLTATGRDLSKATAGLVHWWHQNGRELEQRRFIATEAARAAAARQADAGTA